MRKMMLLSCLVIAATGAITQAAPRAQDLPVLVQAPQAHGKPALTESVKIAVWKEELTRAVTALQAALARDDVSLLLSQGNALLYQLKEMEIAYADAKVAGATEEKLDEIADKYAVIVSQVEEIRQQVRQKVGSESRAVFRLAQMMVEDPAQEQTIKAIFSPVADTLESFAELGDVSESLLATAEQIRSSLVSAGFLDAPGTGQAALRAASRLALERKAEERGFASRGKGSGKAEKVDELPDSGKLVAPKPE